MISSEDRRRELSRRLEKECKKPVGEADDDAILSLAEEIDSLVPPEQKFTEAELEKKLADVKLEGNRFIESSTRAQAASRSRAPMSIKWKITIVLVAVFVMIMSVATCADLSDKEAKDRISSIMTANITVTPSFNRCKSYKNIEDLVEEKQISILYPSTLPNGEELTLATYSKENNSDNYDVILTYKKIHIWLLYKNENGIWRRQAVSRRYECLRKRNRHKSLDDFGWQLPGILALQRI